MGNNKGNGIFLGVIGVATLLVAIIGATFAFFGANIASDEGAVTVQSTTLSLGYDDVITGLKTNLIPAESEIAKYAISDEYLNATDEDGTPLNNQECVDDNGNEVCGTYTFTIGNPSFTTAQDLYGSIKVVSNDFTDLYFAIYDESKNIVVDKTAFSTADGDGVISLSALNQKLIASSDDKENASFVADDPKTYTKVTNEAGQSNVRTYKMLIWIDETFSDQTELNSGKTFAASINFTTASDTSGVTGVIAAANANEIQD